MGKKPVNKSESEAPEKLKKTQKEAGANEKKKAPANKLKEFNMFQESNKKKAKKSAKPPKEPKKKASETAILNSERVVATEVLHETPVIEDKEILTLEDVENEVESLFKYFSSATTLKYKPEVLVYAVAKTCSELKTVEEYTGFFQPQNFKPYTAVKLVRKFYKELDGELIQNITHSERTISTDVMGNKRLYNCLMALVAKLFDLWKAENYEKRKELELPECVISSAASHAAQTQMPKAWCSPLEKEWAELFFPNAKPLGQENEQELSESLKKAYEDFRKATSLEVQYKLLETAQKIACTKKKTLEEELNKNNEVIFDIVKRKEEVKQLLKSERNLLSLCGVSEKALQGADYKEIKLYLDYLKESEIQAGFDTLSDHLDEMDKMDD